MNAVNVTDATKICKHTCNGQNKSKIIMQQMQLMQATQRSKCKDINGVYFCIAFIVRHHVCCAACVEQKLGLTATLPWSNSEMIR